MSHLQLSSRFLCLLAAAALFSCGGAPERWTETETRADPAITVGVAEAAASSSRWTQFRGAGGQGHAKASGLPLEWGPEKNVRWKVAVPGQGWSSPVVDAEHVWVTTAIPTPLSEEEKERRLADVKTSEPLEAVAELSLRAVCIDRGSGEILHDIEVLVKSNPQHIHGLNSFASPTPVLGKGRLFCHFGAYGTACVDTARAEVLWRNQDLWIQHENGPGSSPILFEDKLIFHLDGSDTQSICALDTVTGKVAWRTSRSGKMNDHFQLKKAYGTPVVREIGGRPVLISPAANWLYGYDPRNGSEIWKTSYEVLGFSVVPPPVVGEGMIWQCTCFMQSELIAFRYDVENARKAPEIAWRYKRQVPQQPAPILIDGALYMISDRAGILTCLDAKTGEVRYRQRVGGDYSSSLLYADAKLFVSSRNGTTTVVQPGAEYVELAKNQLEGRHMASLVAVDREIYARTSDWLYRLEASSSERQ